MRYSSYYLYRKYEQRDGQDVLPVIPATYSFDADGTMPKVLHRADDPSCDIINPKYRWVNMDINTDYWCELCSGSSGLSDDYKVKIHYQRYDNTYDEYTIPCNSSTTLWSSDLEQYRNIDTAIIGNCVTEIGNSALAGNRLLNVFVPSSVIRIQNNAFSGQNLMCSCVLPKTLKYIGPGVFNGCYSLQNLELYDEIEVIGDSAFYKCGSLMHIHIPTKLNTISNNCFAYCTGLLNVNIPSGVTIIGSSAFTNCVSLTGISIPNSVTTIGDNAFRNCQSFPVENNIRYADTCALGVTDMSFSTYTIRNGTRFLEGTFINCQNLIDITIPNNVIGIGSYTFWGCKNLNRLNSNTDGVFNIPSGVTYIGYGAFQGCKSLTSISKLNSVTRIGEDAFCNCTSLTSVTIGNSVTSIEYAAFANCTGLTSIVIEATTPPAIPSSGTGAFDGSSCPIYVPAASVNAYKTTYGWLRYASRIQAI